MSFQSKNTKQTYGHFISLSDMMTVLMMVFMLLTLIHMRNISEKSQEHKGLTANHEKLTQEIQEIIDSYKNIQALLYQDLKEEFKHDFLNWNVSLKKDLSITFNSPNVLFDNNQYELKETFKEILSNFFPRYIKTIENYSDDIVEIRIEGYTDSTGVPGKTKIDNYFYNMQLSQNRTRNVLEYCLTLPELNSKQKWLQGFITANGLSSSHLKYDSSGKEDKNLSRRVEFRVKLDYKDHIREIIETLED